ncbi:MAG: ATP-binding protein, partial [Bacteroidota bacterium]
DSLTNNRYALAVVEDQTDHVIAESKRKEATNRAIRSNKLLSEVSQLGRIGAWELDLNTNICEWSDMVYDIHQVVRDKKIDVEEAIKFYHPDHQQIMTDIINKALKSNMSWDEELMIITSNKTERWVRAIGQSVVNKKGKIVKLRGLFQDIHEKKLAEIKLRATGETLKQMVEEKTKDLQIVNQELESFSYSVSHDLRTPLRAINGFSEALIEDYSHEIPEGAGNYLRRISANSQKMAQLIDDLLAFSRTNRKKIEYREFDTSRMINRIIKDIFNDAAKFIEVQELPNIFGDEQMVNQVFTNLISNAIKYSSKENKPEINISSKETETDHIISISDNGIGFNMEYYDKLFQVFQRLHTDREFEGTGVGLSLCAKIMKSHDGDIWAESIEGEGSTFYLKFKKKKIQL